MLDLADGAMAELTCRLEDVEAGMGHLGSRGSWDDRPPPSLEEPETASRSNSSPEASCRCWVCRAQQGGGAGGGSGGGGGARARAGCTCAAASCCHVFHCEFCVILGWNI